MRERLDEEYVEWLYSQVANPNLKNPRKTFWSLLHLLFDIEFDWSIPNDDNRLEDGRQLRHEFLDVVGVDMRSPLRSDEWADDPGCSFLEMLIALSRHLAFEAEGEVADWFWHLLDNIGLRDCYDASKYEEDLVEAIVHRVINREYAFDGSGGLFPLQRPHQNQREVELWYQMNAYLLEKI